MLSTLREFALAHLLAGEEWDALRQRHADYFLSFARLAEPQLTGRQQLAWLERLEKELPNLRQALDWTLQASIDQSLHLAVALFPFWHARSYLNEGRYYLERALAACTAPTPLRARALAVAGLLAQRQGDFQRATQLITQGVALNRQLEEPIGLAYALNNLAIVLMSEGDNEAALQSANESQAICVQQAYPLGLARAEMILGQVALNEDRLAEARQALETSLAFWRTHGDLKNEILCLINLGRAGIMQGRYAEALSLFEECLALSRQLKDLQWELVALWNSAEIPLRRGSPQQAAPLLQSCLDHSRRLGDRYFEALSLGRLGVVALERRAQAEHDTDHVIAVYRVDGHWGAVAKSNYTGCRYREPVYRSIGTLVFGLIALTIFCGSVASTKVTSMPTSPSWVSLSRRA